MTKSTNLKDEFVFRENQNGKLCFVGDFDGLYASNIDPWGQSANTDIDYKKYYNFSRTRIVNSINNIENRKTVLEIGCGTGFVLDFLAGNLPNTEMSGMDISEVAIERARNNFPEHNFIICDIQSSEFSVNQKFDIVIFNQILWYILEDLNTALLNAHKLLNADGHFLISNAFLKDEQRFGSEIINGFNGCQEFIKIHQNQFFSLIDSQFEQSGDFLFNDGLLTYQKLSA